MNRRTAGDPLFSGRSAEVRSINRSGVDLSICDRMTVWVDTSIWDRSVDLCQTVDRKRICRAGIDPSILCRSVDQWSIRRSGVGVCISNEFTHAPSSSLTDNVPNSNINVSISLCVQLPVACFMANHLRFSGHSPIHLPHALYLPFLVAICSHQALTS